VATPIAPSTALPAKFAVAEKHMRFLPEERLERIFYSYHHPTATRSGFSWEKAARRFTASTTPIGNPL
jgi:hypothetical protein